MGAQKIMVLGTGGTIAGSAARAGDNVGYRAGERSVQSLLETLGELVPPHWSLHSEQVAQIDSKDADFSFWAALSARCAAHLADGSVSGIVVTHGTDTLEEAVWLLASTLLAHKPVVLTCAMRPATAISPDGPQNLADALALAGDARAAGVRVVCAGQVHLPRHVQKLHPYRADAFGSGDAGPAGWIEEGKLRLAHPWVDETQGAYAHMSLPLQDAQWPWVEVVQSHAGASGKQIDALVQAGVRGLVVAGTGNGTLHHVLEAALKRAHGAGVVVRVASRCPFGQVVGIPAHGLPLSDGLSPVKSRISVMLELLQAEQSPGANK